ncbi:MAG TPA: FG-GAP-like repeat-containing protein [Anaeromyxobacteraceae bacterium]|nr:FG-GAP-like repeat-containing protein [Anaeromyxobacteraceae bacterium]
MRHARRLTAALAGALAVACGGGTGGTGGPAAPTADAGTAQVAAKGDVVTLDGSASAAADGRALTYRWTQTAGTQVVISNATSARASFLAPHASGTLVFSLVVNDGRRDSPPALTQVEVRNVAPVAEAPAGNVLAESGRLVALDGSRSWDPDGDPLTHAWVQLSGPSVALAGTGAIAQFTAPTVTGQVRLAFSLVVSDGEASSAAALLEVTVVPVGANWPPTANAGADQTAARNASVALTGWGSDREYDPLTYRWTQTSGPTVTLSGATGPYAAFTAPAVECDLGFQLAVSDAMSTSLDDVVVHVRNQAPSVSVVIAPASPGTLDDLVASATAVDPDGDPVTLTWSWKRNGAAVASATGPTLPAGETTRGDVLTVMAVASDGALVGTAEASVTIRDTPPILASDAPATAAHGEAVTFHLSAYDPDGDPVGTFALAYGPAGMQVSPDGLVTWPAELPMFDTSLDVHWGAVIGGASPGELAGTIRVVDASRREPLRRTGIEIPMTRGGLVVADLDGDGRAEMLIAGAGGAYELARSASGYEQRWMHPFALGGVAPQAVAALDLDGDGKAEIFLAGGGAIVELDGATRREVARLDGAPACAEMKLADLEGDGSIELVCLAPLSSSYGTSSKVVVLDAATLRARWETPALALGGALAVGNVDADPALEIVTAGGYVFDGKTQANEWAYGAGFGTAVDVGDLDGDGVAEIVGIVDWAAIRVFSATAKSPLYEFRPSWNDLAAVWVGDIDRDGKAEVLVGDGQWGNVTAYRYDPKTLGLAVVWQIDSQNHGVTAIGAGDVDGDGALEFVWGSGATSSGEDSFVIAGLNPTIGVEWTNTNPNELDGPFIGARLARVGGGAQRLVFASVSTNSSYDGTRIVYLDPATGAWQTSAEVGTNWNRSAALDVADLDGDGVDEVLLQTSDYYDGYFTVWDPAKAAADWTSPKDVGSAASVTHADLNGDGYPDFVALTADGYVHLYDIKQQALLWKSTGLGGYGLKVAVADVDGDGAPEVVALTSTRAVVFHASSGATPWLEAASYPVSGGLDLVVADGDGDGRPEVFVLTGGGYPSTPGVVRLDGALLRLGSFAIQGSAVSLHVEDLGTARHNLILSTGDPYAYYGSPADAMLRAVDAVGGREIWRSPALLGTVARGSLSYVDAEGDARREIAFGTSSGMYLTR